MVEESDAYYDDEYPEFKCVSCGVNTLQLGEYYMIHRELWVAVTGKRERKKMMCIGCVEQRLGRALNFHDFTTAPVNSSMALGKSSRFIHRYSTYI